jgi:hypothetical protein
MTKTYKPQLGPNLTFWDMEHGANSIIAHSHGCGGIIVQKMNNNFGIAKATPDHSAGKLFCWECGHKVGKSPTRAIKGNLGDFQGAHFPKRDAYTLVSRISTSHGETIRHWEWLLKKEAAEIKSLQSLGEGLPRLKPLSTKVTLSEEGDTWVIKHPVIVLNFSCEEFTLADVRRVQGVLKSPRHRGKGANQIHALAMKTLGINAVKNQAEAEKIIDEMIIQRPGSIVLLEEKGYVVFDKQYWGHHHVLSFFAGTLSDRPGDLLDLVEVARDFACIKEKPDSSVVVVSPDPIYSEKVKFKKRAVTKYIPKPMYALDDS